MCGVFMRSQAHTRQPRTATLLTKGIIAAQCLTTLQLHEKALTFDTATQLQGPQSLNTYTRIGKKKKLHI